MFCPNCGKENADGAKFCERCGIPIGNESDAQQQNEDVFVTQQTENTDTPAANDYTAQQAEGDDKAWQAENANIPRQDGNSAQPPAPKSKKKLLVFGIVFGVVFLCLAAAGITLFATGIAQKQVIKFKIERYAKASKIDEQIECYEQLLEMDDTDEEVYISLAELYVEEGNTYKAQKVLKQGKKKIENPTKKFDDLYDEVFAKPAKEPKSKDSEDSGDDDSSNVDSANKRKATASAYDILTKKTAAETAAGVKIVSTDVSAYPLVRIYLDVNDGYGNQIALSSPNAAIKEAVGGGEFIEREVKRIERLEGNQGLSIELIADKSGSMSGVMDRVKSVMIQFVNSLDYSSGDQVELISFDSYVMYMCTKTRNVSLLNNGINNMMPTGLTAFYDALYEGVLNAGIQSGARCVIAFSDGDDNESIHTYQEVINFANQNSVPIYIIGTDRSAESTLRSIADSTNGHYWHIDDLTGIGAIFNDIYKEQKDYYCIEYVSDDAADRYAQRKVDFIIEDGNSYATLTDVFTPIETLQTTSHSSRYEIIPADISWTEANTACILRGGHLATITSQDEMNQLIQQAEASGLTYLWIGGYTSVNGYQAFGHWVTGEPFNYTAWFDGEPSRNDKDGVPEMYLMMWKVKGAWSWNDQRNDPGADYSYFKGKTGYICEYEE